MPRVASNNVFCRQLTPRFSTVPATRVRSARSGASMVPVVAVALPRAHIRKRPLHWLAAGPVPQGAPARRPRGRACGRGLAPLGSELTAHISRPLPAGLGLGLAGATSTGAAMGWAKRIRSLRLFTPTQKNGGTVHDCFECSEAWRLHLMCVNSSLIKVTFHR